MSTDAQISANQANAQLSTGPRTGEGKAISSRNNLRLGFRSQTVILPGEDPAEYDALLTELSDHFKAEDLTERRFVREMADAEWRLHRLRASLESALTRRIETLAVDHPGAIAIELQSRAIETLGTTTGCSYGTWLRYETKFERQYDRAYKEWTRYQDARRKVADKEADIWMRKAIFEPLPPGAPPPTTITAGHHPASQMRELSAQAATRAAVVRGTEATAQAAKLASNVQDAENAPGSVSVPSRDSNGAVRSHSASTVQIARKAPCPCGSGDKFKRCCGKNAPPVLGKAA